ncbi:MAG: membrane protein [Chloroflexota bacterium]
MKARCSITTPVSRFTLHPFISFLLLLTVTLASYAGAFRGDFQFDDVSTILENPHLDRWDTFAGHLDHMIRPVLYFTFFIDRSVYGNSAAGYHILNLLLHLGCGLLVYRVLRRAVTEKTPDIPLWVAMAFLVHPITTETVTYVSGRASGLMAFWYLLALFSYIKATEGPRGHLAGRMYYVGAIASFLLSLASKETAMTFPIALLLWDLVVRRLKGAALRQAFYSYQLPFWFVLLMVGSMMWGHPRYAYLAQFSLNVRPVWDNVLSQIHAVVYALLVFFSPWKQNVDHDLPVFHSLTQWPLFLDLLVIGGLAMAAVLAARHLPLITFGLGWLFLQLIPTNSIIPRLDLLSERNLYLGSIGFLLIVVLTMTYMAQWLTRLLGRARVVQVGMVTGSLALVVLLCLATTARNALYHDAVLLWSDAVQKSPQKARPHNNLGHAYAEQGKLDLAIEEFRIALTLQPDYPLAQKNLLNAYLRHVDRD